MERATKVTSGVLAASVVGIGLGIGEPPELNINDLEGLTNTEQGLTDTNIVEVKPTDSAELAAFESAKSTIEAQNRGAGIVKPEFYPEDDAEGLTLEVIKELKVIASDLSKAQPNGAATVLPKEVEIREVKVNVSCQSLECGVDEVWREYAPAIVKRAIPETQSVFKSMGKAKPTNEDYLADFERLVIDHGVLYGELVRVRSELEALSGEHIKAVSELTAFEQLMKKRGQL